MTCQEHKLTLEHIEMALAQGSTIGLPFSGSQVAPLFNPYFPIGRSARQVSDARLRKLAFRHTIWKVQASCSAVAHGEVEAIRLSEKIGVMLMDRIHADVTELLWGVGKICNGLCGSEPWKK